MREFWNTISAYFLRRSAGGSAGFRRERWFLLYALIAFVVIDYITGVMCAISDKKLSNAVGFKGDMRKVLDLRSGRRRAYS